MRRGAATGIAEALRRDIVSMTLAPGLTISRRQLQMRFGTSSTPISDALLSLQDQHLVTIYPQHATIVSLIDRADAEQASFLRRSVELEVVKVLAETRRPADLAWLHDSLRLQTAVAAIDRTDEFLRLDIEFHSAMYRMAGVSDLWDLVCKRSANLDRLRHLNLSVRGKIELVLVDHEQVLDAIVRGDVAGAQGHMRYHLSQTIGIADELAEIHPDYFKA